LDDGEIKISKKVYFPNDKGKLKLSLEGKILNSSDSTKLNHIEKKDIINDFWMLTKRQPE
jgi:hypothetical protein